MNGGAVPLLPVLAGRARSPGHSVVPESQTDLIVLAAGSLLLVFNAKAQLQ